MDETKNEAPRFLWKFNAYFGRMGSLDALFTASQEEIDAAVGREVYFGEVLGKHSEISLTLEASHFEKVEKADAAFVALFDELGLANGHNPLGYLDDEEDEDEEEGDEE